MKLLIGKTKQRAGFFGLSPDFGPDVLDVFAKRLLALYDQREFVIKIFNQNPCLPLDSFDLFSQPHLNGFRRGSDNLSDLGQRFRIHAVSSPGGNVGDQE